MTRTHQHRALKSKQATGPFSGPVASPQNECAHGGVTHYDWCRCGALRKTNVNGNHRERGHWVPAPRGLLMARKAVS